MVPDVGIISATSTARYDSTIRRTRGVRPTTRDHAVHPFASTAPTTTRVTSHNNITIQYNTITFTIQYNTIQLNLFQLSYMSIIVIIH